ncbi:MAG TPA: ATP-binding cassette domain-containing protein, partial [Acidimicrobiales bacterium]|nr:ATP-binding cassette domain-containing protein [Acidimicrobiales bacterium]
MRTEKIDGHETPRRPGGRTMIEVRDVVKAYGETRALRGVSFRVPDGGVTALLGPNGAGKTT